MSYNKYSRHDGHQPHIPEHRKAQVRSQSKTVPSSANATCLTTCSSPPHINHKAIGLCHCNFLTRASILMIGLAAAHMKAFTILAALACNSSAHLLGVSREDSSSIVYPAAPTPNYTDLFLLHVSSLQCQHSAHVLLGRTGSTAETTPETSHTIEYGYREKGRAGCSEASALCCPSSHTGACYTAIT